MMLVINPDKTWATWPAATSDTIRQAVGEPGWARVRLNARLWPRLCGWVNDNGYGQRLPRNPLGACVLVAHGAGLNPYAGPVVITGWRYPSTGSEICDLDEQQHADLELACGWMRWVLGLDGDDAPGPGHQAWRNYARYVQEAPAPEMQMVMF